MTEPIDQISSWHSLRLVTWNIRHGGGKRWPGIAEALAEQKPDVIVLTEWRPDAGLRLAERLRQGGWLYQEPSVSTGNRNALLVASRTPLRRSGHESTMFQDLPGDHQMRWLEVELSSWTVPRQLSSPTTYAPLRLGAVHVPEVGGAHSAAARTGQEDRKRLFWLALLDLLRQRSQYPFMLLGDINTGLPGDVIDPVTQQPLLDRQTERLFSYADGLRALRDDLGWREAWRMLHPRSYEYSYKAPRYGYRLDHAWLGPFMQPHLLNAQYLHEARVTRSLSDHSPLLIDVRATSLTPASATGFEAHPAT